MQGQGYVARSLATFFFFCFCFGPGHEAQVFGIAPTFPADLAFFCGWTLCTLVNYLDGVLHGEDFAALGWALDWLAV